ncbi:Uncharacterized protein LW93_11232 [Fusarium fujikuroi]|nr:Uncharacterized protein LW93_11232 [Fusarium fujikuroi]
MKRKNSQSSGRRVRSKRTERISWSNTERLQLLAYLDWCVQSQVKFEATAPGYLKNATGRHFSVERIRRKLYQEWSFYGICERFNDLFERGTAGLLPLPSEQQEYFHKIFASINPAKPPHYASSRSFGLDARSRTLTNSGLINSVDGSGEPSGFSTSLTDKSNVVPEHPRQKTIAKPFLGPTKPSNDDLTEDELASGNNPDNVQGEDETRLSAITSPEFSDMEFSDMELEFNPTVSGLQKNTLTVVSQARSSSSLEPRLSQPEALLLKEKVYCLTLENRIFELEERNRDLEDCIRLASSAQETEIIQDMRNTLHHAFNVKIELMLSVKRLKHLFFKPGTLFDGKKMEVVKSQARDSALLGQEVQICLLPALFAASEGTDETGDGEETSLSASYRQALPGVTDEDIESLVLVEKAIVFLKRKD